jgi:hypothetical protein
MGVMEYGSIGVLKLGNDFQLLQAAENEGVKGGVVSNEDGVFKKKPLIKILRVANPFKIIAADGHEVAVEFRVMDIGIGVHLFQGIIAVVVGFKIDCKGVHESPEVRMQGDEKRESRRSGW